MSVMGWQKTVPPGSGSVELQMRRLRLLFCGTMESLDIRRQVPKILKVLSAFSKVLNPQDTRSTSSSRQKVVASGVRVETCGTCRISALMMSRDQGSPTAAGKPWDSKVDKRSVLGFWDVGGGGAIVGDWNNLMKSFKLGSDDRPSTRETSATNDIALCNFLTCPPNVTWFVSDQVSRPVSYATKGHWAPKRRQRN